MSGLTADQAIEWLKNSIETWPEEVRPQIALQVEAISAAMDRDRDEGEALMQFLSDGLGRVERNKHGGFDVVLTEKGLASAAALVREMVGMKPN